jgi:ABC-type uncharacterized transport system permease subunit
MIPAAVLAVVLYCLASWQLGAPSASLGGRTQARSRVGLLVGLAAIGAHGATHALAWLGVRGVDLTFFAALSLVALGMAALSTMVAWTRNFESLGSIVYPVAALSLLAYALAGPQAAAELDWPLQLHALLALLAYAALALSAVLALMLWAQERMLRQRRLDHPLLRLLPPLTELEELLFRTIAAGFVMLTLALLTGVVFVENLFAQHLAHKTVLSVLSWLAFGALLFGRFQFGWRGRRAVQLTLAAMALLVLAFFGSKFVLELLLQRTA